MITTRRKSHGTRLLWLLVFLAALYCLLPADVRTILGNRTIDGTIGVALGLFICSRPAANAVDVLFYSRGGLRQAAAGTNGLIWLALNLAVLFVGWVVIVVGATRLVA